MDAVNPLGHRNPRVNGYRSPGMGDEEVSMSLLGESERQAAAVGLDSDHHDEEKRLKAPMSAKDKSAMALLITLCTYLLVANKPVAYS